MDSECCDDLRCDGGFAEAKCKKHRWVDEQEAILLPEVQDETPVADGCGSYKAMCNSIDDCCDDFYCSTKIVGDFRCMEKEDWFQQEESNCKDLNLPCTSNDDCCSGYCDPTIPAKAVCGSPGNALDADVATKKLLEFTQ